MSYVKASEAAKYYGVATSTVRMWARTGQIQVQQSGNQHFKYIINKPTTPVIETNEKRNQNIIYARVSSKKQEPDLQRQITYLKKRYSKSELITDIGSGINYSRNGFKTILEGVFKGDIKQVVVAHKDRFSRFGFDLFSWIFSQFGAELIVVENPKSKQDITVELANDLMEIITVFSARYHGRRGYPMHTKSKILSK